nr:hypothetical protein [Tanacetum cinerariifolium]
MRIEQYFLMIDYSLWEVILNGDSPIPTSVVNGVVQPIAPTTAEQRLAKKIELKAMGTLLMALPDKHQLKFNIHKVLGIKCRRHSHCQERVPTGSISSHCQWRVFPLPVEGVPTARRMEIPLPGVCTAM